MAMLGDIVELSVVVNDLDAAAARFTKLFGLRVHRRDTWERFGFKNAILPTGIGHIELMQPTDPGKAVGKFLAKRGEGVQVDSPRLDIAWVHPRQTHGLFVELRHREHY